MLLKLDQDEAKEQEEEKRTNPTHAIQLGRGESTASVVVVQEGG